MAEIRKLIKSIKVDKANFEYISKTGNINGTLSIDRTTAPPTGKKDNQQPSDEEIYKEGYRLQKKCRYDIVKCDFLGDNQLCKNTGFCIGQLNLKIPNLRVLKRGDYIIMKNDYKFKCGNPPKLSPFNKYRIEKTKENYRLFKLAVAIRGYDNILRWYSSHTILNNFNITNL